MLKIKFGIHSQSELVQTVFAKIPDLKEFFMKKFNDESISKTDIFNYINHRAKCAEHGNNIFKTTKEQA